MYWHGVKQETFTNDHQIWKRIYASPGLKELIKGNTKEAGLNTDTTNNKHVSVNFTPYGDMDLSQHRAM